MRKIHLAGERCPSSSGGDSPTTAPLSEFVRLPFAARCAACSKRVPVSAIPDKARTEAQAWRKVAQQGMHATPSDQQREALRRGRETLAKMTPTPPAESKQGAA